MSKVATSSLEAFFRACASGDLIALRELLDRNPALVHERHEGTTGLHLAVRHPEAVRLLLERGADPNARDEGDHALPLHFAAAAGSVDSVRALLDAGSDVQGAGDLHAMDAIGWATVFEEPKREVVDLLVERGARHHVFSAIALNHVELLRSVVEADPGALSRRLSRYEQEQTPVHYVVAPADGLVGGTFRTGEHYRLLDALIELGADLNARDARGRTALELAMLRGDEAAMRRLYAAGAALPGIPDASPEQVTTVAKSVGAITPMVAVADVAATVAWYQAIGFELAGSHGEDGRLDWACVQFGSAEIMFVPAADPVPTGRSGISLWLQTDRLDELYAALKARQLARARALLLGETTAAPEIPFTADLYTAFYGQREFGIHDPNRVELMFCQPVK